MPKLKIQDKAKKQRILLVRTWYIYKNGFLFKIYIRLLIIKNSLKFVYQFFSGDAMKNKITYNIQIERMALICGNNDKTKKLVKCRLYLQSKSKNQHPKRTSALNIVEVCTYYYFFKYKDKSCSLNRGKYLTFYFT